MSWHEGLRFKCDACGYDGKDFKLRTVTAKEHNPGQDLFRGERNVCCPKCKSMRISVPPKKKRKHRR